MQGWGEGSWLGEGLCNKARAMDAAGHAAQGKHQCNVEVPMGVSLGGGAHGVTPIRRRLCDAGKHHVLQVAHGKHHVPQVAHGKHQCNVSPM